MRSGVDSEAAFRAFVEVNGATLLHAARLLTGDHHQHLLAGAGEAAGGGAAMSPSESELRAALRSGEGAAADADAVIAHARGVRHARRMRLGSIVGAVVVVGGIAAGVVTLRGGQTAPGSSTHPGATVSAGCPAPPPRLMLPGGGGTGQFGANGPLFAKPVGRLLVCGYQPAGLFRSTTLTGRVAQQVATSLNAAPVTPEPIGECPELQPPPRLLLRAPRQPDVTATIGPCTKITITNGTAVRYQWQAPPQVRAVMLALTRQQSQSLTTVPAPGRRYSDGPAPRPTR